MEVRAIVIVGTFCNHFFFLNAVVNFSITLADGGETVVTESSEGGLGPFIVTRTGPSTSLTFIVTLGASPNPSMPI